MGALNTVGKVTFLPEDSPFSEYTDISGRVHAMAGRGEGHAPLNPAAPTGKVVGHLCVCLLAICISSLEKCL